MFPVVASALSGAYHGGLSYLLDFTKADKKVFDFAAPKVTHALAFGIFSSLANSCGEVFVRNLTNTRFGTESGMYSRRETTMYSSNPVAYKYGCFAVELLSLFGTAYALNQMNYRIPTCYIPISMTPIILCFLYNNS
ncbi:hypothetical protein [Simkania negevensis]|uniref:hypothetical protein n=1 Tax=Simkania negevensis TaxID=83561 RepID=UPI0002ECD770|nr:hypothetical protein [Simkania negevensis]